MEITNLDSIPACCSHFSPVEILLVLIILNCLIILRDISSSFHCVFRVFSGIFSNIKKKIQLCADKNIVNQEPEAAESAINAEDSGREKMMTVEEVRMTMEELAGLEEKIDGLFEEGEPSLEEVKAAFALFDKNEDGFIDASELRNVLCGLSLAEASEAECTNMITSFDDDKDGRIDFCEFVKLLDRSFSS